MKKIVQKYQFIPAENKITVDGIYSQEKFLIITNVTLNKTIYAFNNTTQPITSISFDYTTSQTTIVLSENCSAMNSTDVLQIFVEIDNTIVEPSEPFIDPVNKIRVSQPQNLIDTDFEYGLQSSKWETLEQVKNIPTFFGRNGDTTVPIVSMTTTNNSDVVTVQTTIPHNFTVGTPVIVIGSSSITCDGTFITTKIVNTTTFQYKSKATQQTSGSILGEFTQLYAGKAYQGTEFDISTIDAIVTDGLNPSTLTFKSKYPTKFEEDTSFFLSNSIGQTSTLFSAGDVDVNLTTDIQRDVINNTPTGETGFALGAVQPYLYGGTEAIYFRQGTDTTVNTTGGVETITFTSPHGMIDNETYLYVAGEGNDVIGGLSDYTGYYVRVVNTNTIYLTTTSGGTTRVNLSSQGTDAGVVRSCFIRGYRAVSTDGSSAQESITFNRNHGLTSDSNQALLFFNGAANNLDVSTNLLGNSTFVYYPKTVRSATALSFTTSPGGAQISLSTFTTTASAVMIRASLLENANTIFFEDHSLTNNTNVVFTVQSGTGPTGLTSGSLYKVEPVGANRLRFKNPTTQAVISLDSIGTNNAPFRVVAKFANTNNDSIIKTSHGLSNGDLVTYDNRGNTTIGGLTNNSNYYVFQATTDRFKLSSTEDPWVTDPILINQSTQVNTSTNVITSSVSHGFSTGSFVQYLSSTPIGGLVNGAFYHARSITATTFSLHWSFAGAFGNTDIVVLDPPLSGTGTFRRANLVDLTTVGTGTQNFKNISNSATDGVYRLDTRIDDRSYILSNSKEIPFRELVFASETDVNLTASAINIINHGLTTGTPVVYTTSGTVVGGLTNSVTYYVIRVNNKWIRLATSAANAADGVSITFTNSQPGSGVHRLTTSTISGETTGIGTISTTAGSAQVTGEDVLFSSTFVRGDNLIIYKGETTNSFTFASNTVDAGGDALVGITVPGDYATGDAVKFISGTPPGGLIFGNIYYIRVLSTSSIAFFPTPADAIANTNRVNITSSGTSAGRNITKIVDIGATFVDQITFVSDISGITLTNTLAETLTNQEYGVNTKIIIRADGFALHRPFDGGVELIPSKNPDSQMIRQTRKYFRYQSGKGLQISFAINFKPSVDVDTISRVGTVATVTTRFPHRLETGLPIVISGATVSSGTNFWNGEQTVTSVIDDYRFTFTLPGTPADITARGIIQYYVKEWTNSETRCGVFDDQNGMFFDFNGQTLSCCRRNSTTQISGTVSVNFKDSTVIGTNTKFTSQLFENDMIVIKGQTYQISKIDNDTVLYILPSYRGIDTTNAIVSKVIDVKVPQSEWNLDKCDGTGRSGYKLELNKIQMVYIDYAWYGAGKIRFGFKNQRGDVIYVHEFIHNNVFNEAYLRSGNLPARYEIKNLGKPSYVPALAHWGTSVIMDGRFDNDESYVFAANSNVLSISSNSTVTVSASTETTSNYQIFVGGSWRTAGPALLVATPSTSFNSIAANSPVSGANINANALTRLPTDTLITPRQPYLASVDSRILNSSVTRGSRNLLILNSAPTSVNLTPSNYTVTLSATATPVVYEQPIISIRLAPSVDSGIPGALGQREVINRMQLILDDINILTTHTAQIILKLNGALTSQAWQRVNNPSLSQLMYHSTNDRIIGGTLVYSFRAQGNTGTNGRTPFSTIVNLKEVISLGNSILGGDNPYPDGPDVLTVSAILVEDPSTVTTNNPFNISTRLSWKESQA